MSKSALNVDDLLALILLPLEADQAALCQSIRQHFEETRQDLEEYGTNFTRSKKPLRIIRTITLWAGGWTRQAVAGGRS